MLAYSFRFQKPAFAKSETVIGNTNKDDNIMRNTDLNKVAFNPRKDMAGGYNLQKGEHILITVTQSNYTHTKAA